MQEIRIPLDGRLKASLDWTNEGDAARESIENGNRIIWDLDLGLASRLERPLSNQTQFQSFCLSLEHFRDTLWKEFKKQTAYLCIYRAPVDFSKGYPWDTEQVENWHGWLEDHFETIQNYNEETHSSLRTFEESDPLRPQNEFVKHLVRLFCRDVIAEYLELLAARLPDGMKVAARFDADEIQDPLELAQLSAKDRFERLHLDIPWFYHEPDRAKTAVCLPSMDMVRPSQCAGLGEAFEYLQKESIPFRIIPESMLITEWDGLDDLIYSPAGLTFQGKRKLQGFCAAGGRVISMGPLLGLPNEIGLKDLTK